MIITESELRRIIRQEILNESLSINSSEELSKVNHNWVLIDDHIPDCVFYADLRSDSPEVDADELGLDSREDKSEQPVPSKCLKIKIDIKSRSAPFYYDLILKGPAAILKKYNEVIRMLPSCNLEEGEICIEILKNDESFNSPETSLSIEMIIDEIITAILDQSDFLPRSAKYRS